MNGIQALVLHTPKLTGNTIGKLSVTYQLTTRYLLMAINYNGAM